MAKILISGLVNTETSVRVRQFPVEYYPIDYAFFGVNTAVSGVACNIALAAAAPKKIAIVNKCDLPPALDTQPHHLHSH